jgi:hypothetical protein
MSLRSFYLFTPVFRAFGLLFALLWVLNLVYSNLRDEKWEFFRYLAKHHLTPQEMKVYDRVFNIRDKVSRLTSTNSRWMMYGWQFRHNNEFRIVGTYQGEGGPLYRDLYIPYSFADYYLTFLSTPWDIFFPVEKEKVIPIREFYTSQLLPKTPLPPLSLHPDVPPPEFDPKLEKFHDNLFGNNGEIVVYALSFAAKYPFLGKNPLQSVSIYIYQQPMLPIDPTRSNRAVMEDFVEELKLVEVDTVKSQAYFPPLP